METFLTILKKYWGYTEFRPQQLAAIEAVTAGKDVLALLPTGAGKSLCFQVPTLYKKGICIVVSPLLALMQDQVKDLSAMGITAISLGGQLNGFEEAQVFTAMQEKKYQFVYCSPEKLAQKHFQELLSSLEIQMFAIDEAHCISQWGYDFRPSYRKLRILKDLFPNTPILAMTASAIPIVQLDIIKQLNLQQPTQISDHFLRPNLAYHVALVAVKLVRLKEILQATTGSIIIYCNTRNNVSQLAQLLQLYGFNVGQYHAGMHLTERQMVQANWMQNKLQIIICTNAFGMGINKTDVNMVVHYDLPANIEQYYQEAGRAGRNGQPAKAILLYQQNDFKYWESLQEKKIPSIETIKNVYQDLADYVKLPFGLGALQEFLFDFETFCIQFNWDKIIARNALEWIAQEGHVKFAPASFKPTMVQVIADRNEIENFEVQHPIPGFVLQTLLRSYGGIIDNAQFINEGMLSKLLQRDPNFVNAQLLQLSAFGMIRYEQKANQPVVQFIWDRTAAAFMAIDMDRYQARKKAFQDRTTAMRAYILGTHLICRNVFLAGYFGEKEPKKCGICDICSSTKN